jgi:hypothetical protein
MTTIDDISPTIAITSDEIDKCIAILAQLNLDTDQYLPLKTQRTALIKAAGHFQDPIEMNLRAEKDGKLVAKRKKRKR